jgi:hypothetical protein
MKHPCDEHLCSERSAVRTRLHHQLSAYGSRCGSDGLFEAVGPLEEGYQSTGVPYISSSSRMKVFVLAYLDLHANDERHHPLQIFQG